MLRWFGSKEGYEDFVEQGIARGNRPELVGGGSLRSQGGWSAVKGMSRSGTEEHSDERVLGSGEFVDRLLADAEEKIKCQLAPLELARRVHKIVEQACARGKVGREVLLSVNRRRRVSEVRAELVNVLME